MIPENKILELTYQLGQQLHEAHKAGKRGLQSISKKNGNFQLIFNDEDSTPTTEIARFVYMILQKHSELVPADLHPEVLLNHLGMLAPNLPVDFLPIITDALASPEAQRFARFEPFIQRLESAIQRHAIRESQGDDEYEWEIGFDTHIGMRKALLSQTNQDALFYATHKNVAVLLVADGISVSTAGSGNLASNITTQVVEHYWNNEKDNLQEANLSQLREFLINTLVNANYSICENARKLANGKLENEIPMGSTALFAVMHKEDVLLANLGDSRVYLQTEGGVALLTGDQNLRGEKLRHCYPIEDAEQGFALIRYLGHFDEQMQPALPVPDIRHFRMLPDETLLLCSDGLTDYAAKTHIQIADLITKALEAENPNAACWYLTQQANAGGGGDNITILTSKLCKFEQA